MNEKDYYVDSSMLQKVLQMYSDHIDIDQYYTRQSLSLKSEKSTLDKISEQNSKTEKALTIFKHFEELTSMNLDEFIETLKKIESETPERLI